MCHRVLKNVDKTSIGAFSLIFFFKFAFEIFILQSRISINSWKIIS